MASAPSAACPHPRPDLDLECLDSRQQLDDIQVSAPKSSINEASGSLPLIDPSNSTISSLGENMCPLFIIVPSFE
jgi:hypothetical protein